MSAIYGIIDLNRTHKIKACSETFEKEYSDCKIDKFSHEYIDNAFMGCGLQYFTKESRAEVLPVYDSINNILFTADCLLDNREEIIDLLAGSNFSTSLYPDATRYDHTFLKEQPDGTLIYLSYLKWKADCVSKLRGIFSFVIYDVKQNTIELFADQFSNRCLFYHVRDGLIYFSTLLFPLIRTSGLSFKTNERWLTDCISVRGPMIITECEETTYEDVFKLSCGTYVTISDNGASVTKHQYYNPISEIKVNKHIDEAEAGKQFVTTFINSVNECLRTDGEVGIELSSGLDSTSVAGCAAPILKSLGKKLYSYTSVPLKGSVENRGYFISDETEGVNSVCQMYSNIEPQFITCENKNVLSESDEVINLWELPCKSQQNAVWLKEICKKASEDGCKVVLSGGTGNNTISSGSIHNYFFDEIVTGHPIKAYKAFIHYFNKYGAVKRDYLKSFLKTLFTERAKHLFGIHEDCYANNVTNRSLGEKHKLTKRFRGTVNDLCKLNSFNQVRPFIYLRNSYSQIGEVDTKHSLKYGIINRDPTKNVELINLLCTFPMEMFVNQDYERRLVREFMQGIIPDGIRLDIRHRGIQSADSMFRIKNCFTEYKSEIKETITSEQLLYYLDRKKMEALIKQTESEEILEDENHLLLLLDLYIFAKYLLKCDNH